MGRSGVRSFMRVRRVAYYNECDPKAAAWLRELIKEGLITDGEVDERSIEDVEPVDVMGFARCHWFAGIGGWDLAFQLAGYERWDVTTWTGSCPCQIVSPAARGRNRQEGDLWPAWLELIAANSPRVVFGEQVAKRWWVDRASGDLEALGYEFGAAILPAHAFGFDHARERLFFVGHANGYCKPVVPIDEKVAGMPRGGSVSEGMVSPDGVSAGMAAMRGFGNAIVPKVAAAFIDAYIRS